MGNFLALQMAMKQLWAIQPEMLETILTIAARENPDLDAVEKMVGRPLDNTRDVQIRNGVAIIPVQGPIIRYASFFSRISGAVSIEDLAKDFNTALDAREVKAIILNMDTPGGEVNGVSEFAQMVFDARKQKPVVAYASNLMASAGYWIGSAAEEIVAQESAQLGSIGVVATYTKFASEGRNWKDYEFVSSQSPNKRPDPEQDDGRRQIQERIDSLADVFVGTVARNRSVSTETVLSDFGQGGVQIGAAAVESGMADRLGNFEELVEELSEKTVFSVTRNTTGAQDKMTLEQLKAKHPELVADIRKEEKAALDGKLEEVKADAFADGKREGEIEGATAERERIKAVHEAGVPGHDKLIEDAMFDGKSTAGDVALAIIGAEKVQREAAAADIKKKHDQVAPATSGADADAEHAEENKPEKSVDFDKLSAEEQAKHLWETDGEFEGEKVQAEFESLETFSAFYKNRNRRK